MLRRDFLLAAGAISFAHAADDESGFQPLFDGSSLDGWTVREGPESAFYVDDGAIVVHRGANFPTWLRYNRRFENFDFRGEFFVKGWSNSGIYFHAPEHGRNTWVGYKVNIFQKQDKTPLPESMGAIFPVVPPKLVNVKSDGQWNTMRILMDWPALRVWTNGELVQDLDVEKHPELRHRFRSGYIGIESLSYPLRFRNLRIRELPSKEKWATLYTQPSDLTKWTPVEKAKWETLGPVLRGDGLGYLATKESFRDFELLMYLRASKHSNGGVLFRADIDPRKPHYEIQVHDVEGAVYPTGSLYGHKRAVYPKIEPEQWYPFQLIVEGRRCIVRINGENVVDYDGLERLDPGPIVLQAHQINRWIEYKEIKVKAL